jgi:hypothetical protein
VHSCPGSGLTTITGTVYDPAANNPLYDIAVFVPNSPPKPFKDGPSCGSCGELYTGDPIVSALTDAAGKFTLSGVPDGTNIPLVLQIGKWRKQLTIPNVTKCANNPVPDRSLTLPKNHREGDIPNIAIATGGQDTLECLLLRIGVDASEYMPGANGPGRIHIFHGTADKPAEKGAADTSPPAPDPATSLWDSSADIMNFDTVMLSCEGHETDNMNQQVLFDYATAGGRIFASHFHYAWLNSGPFGAASLATWTPGNQCVGELDTNIVTTLANGQPFQKGQAMQDWLANVGALKAGKLPVAYACHNADVGAANSLAQPWIVSGTTESQAQYFSVNTPLNAAPEKLCGEVVYSDLHVGASAKDYASNMITPTTPSGCATQKLSSEEAVLEFMIFDLASCVLPSSQPPTAPPPIK